MFSEPPGHQNTATAGQPLLRPWLRDWRDTAWLSGGTLSQRQAHAALTGTNVPGLLEPFDPVLAGTIPLDIDVDGSDLDIICCVPDATRFAMIVNDAFSGCDGYVLRRGPVQDELTTLVRFRAAGCLFEIFGQDKPVALQAAVVHLDVEARLLDFGGELAKQRVRALKRSGLKTEPAFATWLGLSGDPYQALYALGGAADAELQVRVAHAMREAAPG